jgi:hypothetical protein
MIGAIVESGKEHDLRLIYISEISRENALDSNSIASVSWHSILESQGK